MLICPTGANVSWQPVCSNRQPGICDGSVGPRAQIGRELYLDAYRWLTVDEYSSPFSFLNVCQLLNLAPETVRQELVGDLVVRHTRLLDPTLRARRAPVSDCRSASFFVKRAGAMAGMPLVTGEQQWPFNKAASAGGAFVYMKTFTDASILDFYHYRTFCCFA